MESLNSKQLCVDVLWRLENAVVTANSLPKGDELDVLRVTAPSVARSGKELTNQLLAVIRSVTSRYAVSARTTDSDSVSSDSASNLTPRDKLYDETVETTDEALEQFNTSLDAARGIQNAAVQPRGALGPNMRELKIGLGYLGRRQGGFLDMEKPQVHFPDYPIDNSDTAFVPPYSRAEAKSGDEKEAERSSHEAAHVDKYLQDLFKKNSKHGTDRRHPYEDEIIAATSEMVAKKFKDDETLVYGALKDTPCCMVVTEEDLFNVAARLKRANEIAVDLENHSIRSFQGYTCLIQISTRKEDIVIDALKLRGTINRALAPIFTDEAIVKVLHGADKDVQWLERDFGMYVVNMFDTGQAARLLKLPSAALSFLQARYCDLTGTSKKKFQLADWRQRPLPDDMFRYARSDTHYLLYIYDRLRSELSKNQLLGDAWERSAVIARKRHAKIRYDSGMARRLAAKHGLGFDRHQIRLLEELCRWRDVTAREEDESLIYVAPLNTLFGIVRARDKAKTVPGLMTHGFPSRRIPPLVQRHAEYLTRLITDALDARLEDDNEVRQSRQPGITMRELHDTKSNTAGSPRNEIHVEKPSRPADASQLSNKGKDGKEEMRLRKDEEVPMVPMLATKVRALPKSALFDSDAETGSDEDGVSTPPAVSTGTEMKGIGDSVNESIASDDMRSLKADATKDERGFGEDKEEEEEEEEEEEAGATVQEVKAAKSVFDLSDSSDGEGDENSVLHGKRKAKEVAAQLAADLAEKRTAISAAPFLLETDEQPREVVNSAVEVTVKDGDEDEAEAVSLLEAARRKEGSTRKRRRKEGSARKRRRKEKKAKGGGEVVGAVAAYDYSEAAKEVEGRHERKREEKGFDPMERLKVDWSKKERGRVRRRRRGQGKSMSFVAR